MLLTCQCQSSKLSINQSLLRRTRQQWNTRYSEYTQWKNGRRVGHNSGPIFSRLCTKLHQIKFAFTGISIVCNAIFMSCCVQEIFAIKSQSCAKSREIWCFWAAKYGGKGPPKFLTEFHKSESPTTIWQSLVMIGQATSEIGRRKKTKEDGNDRSKT